MCNHTVLLHFKGVSLPEKISSNPAFFTWRCSVQVKDCNSHIHTITLHKKFSLCNAQLSVSFYYSITFLCTGKPDHIIHLNVGSKDHFEMIRSDWQIFFNAINS